MISFIPGGTLGFSNGKPYFGKVRRVSMDGKNRKRVLYKRMVAMKKESIIRIFFIGIIVNQIYREWFHVYREMFMKMY